MKFQMEIPDDIFWDIAAEAERYDLTVPAFLTQVGYRLTVPKEESEAPLETLLAELKAARAAGWRAPNRNLSVRRKPRKLVFTDSQMETALAVMEGKRNGIRNR